jgi:hypothetical protein
MAPPLALLLFVLAIGGASAHHSSLSGPSVAPRELAAGGAVAVSITFTDAGGAAPRSMVAQIGDIRAAMTATSADFASGVRYTAALVPAVGWHDVYFHATNPDGEKEVVAGGRVHVSGSEATPSPSKTPGPTASSRPVPTRTPAPTLEATPDPTATLRPSPTPIVGSGGRGRSGSGDGTGNAGPTPGSNGGASGTGGATPAPGGAQTTPVAQPTPAPQAATTPSRGNDTQPHPGSAGGQTTLMPSGAPVVPGGPAAAMADHGTAAGDGAGTGIEQTEGAMAGGSDPISAALLAPYRHATLATLLRELAPTIATATVGGTAWAAFVIFGKRRRDGDEPEPESLMAASAGAGLDMAAAQGLRAVDESQMPRWRRPSLQQVRKADPMRAVVESAHLSFEAAGVRPLESYERRQIRYRLVRLLDCPDEVRASETGILDRGDEVQLLERHGVYWRVLCPDGRTGWVHRMTLGDPTQPSLVEDAAPAVYESYEAPNIEAYEALCGSDEPQLETVAAIDSDENVAGLLEAYMRARGDMARPAVEPASVESVAAESVAAGSVAAESVAAESEVVEPVESLESASVDPSVESIAAAAAVEPPVAVAPVEAPAAARARDYLAKAGFAVQGPATAEPAPQPAAVAAAPAEVTAPESPSDAASPAAEPGHADGQYSGRKSAGSRKAASASRPGTKSRRPSR